jgi:vacuolar protein sorting-associated protein 29
MGKFRIGVIHGHQIVPWGDEESLYSFLRENNLDILISGHTHEQKISQIDNKYLINPGSVTGVFGPTKRYRLRGD